jgi:hypothetical protein
MQAEALFRNQIPESELNQNYNNLIKEIIDSSLIKFEAQRITELLPKTEQAEAIKKINPKYQSKLKELMNNCKSTVIQENELYK